MSDKQPLPTGLQLTAADPVFREHPHEYLDRLRSEALPRVASRDLIGKVAEERWTS